MNVKAKCQFCSRELTLEVDDEYSRLGDPLKLLRLAACNRCADLKTKQRRIEGRLEYLTSLLLIKKTETEMENFKRSMERTAKDYLRLICEFLRVDYVDWDEAILDALMIAPAPPKPSNLGSVVRRMWQMAKGAPKAQGSLPYKD